MPLNAAPQTDEQDEEILSFDDVAQRIEHERSRVQKAVAISSVKEALLQRVFPLLQDILAAAANGADDDLRTELLGEDDDDADEGVIGEIESRIDDLEENAALLTAGLELRVRLAALARSVKTHASSLPNLVAEADEVLSFVATLDEQVKIAFDAARQATEGATNETDEEEEPDAHAGHDHAEPEPTRPTQSGL